MAIYSVFFLFWPIVSGESQSLKVKRRTASLILQATTTTADVSPWYLFLDATTHLYKRSCPSVGPSVRRSVRPSPVIFKRQKNVIFRVLMTTESDKDQESQGQFKNDIRLSVRRSVCPSDAKKKERKKERTCTISDDEVVMNPAVLVFLGACVQVDLSVLMSNCPPVAWFLSFSFWPEVPKEDFELMSVYLPSQDGK